jgi:hypothetical protein
MPMPLFFTNQGQENPLRRNANDRRPSLQPAPPTVPVFKLKGTDLKPAIPDRLPAVPAMTPAAKAALLKQILNYNGTGQYYARLTPGDPVTANKGSLVFVAPEVVDSGIKLARYPGSQNGTGRQMLWLRADANRQYLVDCIVGTYYTPSNFKIEGPGVSHTVYSAFADDVGKKKISGLATDHIHFVLQAVNSAWYGFAIWNLSTTWFFFSCEVTQL